MEEQAIPSIRGNDRRDDLSVGACVWLLRKLRDAVVADVAERSRAAGDNLDDAVQRALDDEVVSAFESRIDWNEPGLTFLDFNALVSMTVARALEEIES